jgi:hypothetical protein
MTTVRRRFLAGIAPVTLAACSRPALPPGSPTGGDDPPPVAARPQSDTTPAFANRIWRVARSTAGDPGAYYLFLGDGSMLIASSHGTPAVGRWRLAGDTLTLVEEGISHPGSIRTISADSFGIRLGGPGTPVELTFVPGAPR